MTSTAQQLDDYIRAARPFSWRAHHCGHWAAGWVKIRTGRDALAGLHASGLNAALAVCRRYGGLGEAVTALTGWREVPHLAAQIGDLVMMPTDSAIGGALGICAGRDAVYAAVSDGPRASVVDRVALRGAGAGMVAYAPLVLATRAWRAPL